MVGWLGILLILWDVTHFIQHIDSLPSKHPLIEIVIVAFYEKYCSQLIHECHTSNLLQHNMHQKK